MQYLGSLSSPPNEVAPLLARKGYGYARVNGGKTEGFGELIGSLYACFSENFGVWGMARIVNGAGAQGIAALSFAYSYLEHDFFDFFDTNIRLGFSDYGAPGVHGVGPILHVAQAVGMYYWLDIGWYVTCGLGLEECVVGGYIKSDHMFDVLSVQIGLDGIFNRSTIVSPYVLLEFDGSDFDTWLAPQVQWWYRWYVHEGREWNVGAGLNGCWCF